jgi:hydroxymethylglutaryl-CoA lyase
VSTDVSVYEVGLRDGLQNEQAIVPLVDKLRLAQALVAAGLRRIEATSFVSPTWIAQLADADELCRMLPKSEHVTFSALCPNVRGLGRALATDVAEIAVFVSATETHNQKNLNKSIRQSLDECSRVIEGARQANRRVRGYVSMVWGCAYEGFVPTEQSLAVTRELLALGCYRGSLGDTIGAGTPRQSRALLATYLAEFQPSQLAMHMHDTRGTALANVLVGLECGIRDFDAAIGGMGGCPYAAGAAGNVATEDLVYMLHGMGMPTGVDPDAILEAARVAETIVGHTLPGKVHLAGWFPKPAHEISKVK